VAFQTNNLFAAYLAAVREILISSTARAGTYLQFSSRSGMTASLLQLSFVAKEHRPHTIRLSDLRN
jgi:hypothetical protein